MSSEALLMCLLVALCFAGGWYGRRRLIGGLVTAGIGPIVLALAWWILRLGLAFIYLIFYHFIPDSLEGFYWGLPDEIQFILHPATILSAVGLFLYFRYERINHAPPPKGFTDPAGRGYLAQSSPSSNPRILPTTKRFEY